MVNTALFLGFSMIALFLLVAWYVLQVIAYWRVFTKAGEPGWKSLIPIYNTYIQYKISWNPTMFFAFLICTAAGVVFSGMGYPLAIVASLLSLANMVISFMSCLKLSQAFGYGLGFSLGLFFLNPIFLLILGFGSSEYQGPQ